MARLSARTVGLAPGMPQHAPQKGPQTRVKTLLRRSSTEAVGRGPCHVCRAAPLGPQALCPSCLTHLHCPRGAGGGGEGGRHSQGRRH